MKASIGQPNISIFAHPHHFASMAFFLNQVIDYEP